ncbi:hypothetical protein PO909_008410 [Leuciscus waleckii]
MIPSSKSLVSPLVPPSSKSPVSPEFPPGLPLLPPLPITASSSAPLPLVPFSPSAPPLTLLQCVDLPRVFRSPAPTSKEDPPAPPPVADSVTTTRPVDLSAPPWLLPPSAPPDTIALMVPLVPPAPPWSDITLPAPRTTEPSAALRLSTPSAPPWRSVPPAPLQSSGTLGSLQKMPLWLRLGLQDLRYCTVQGSTSIGYISVKPPP